jgi:uncharacterized membrane protein YfcA
MFSGMGMQRAIGTSLLVITLVSASGAASHLWAGQHLTLATAAVFTAGSIAGLLVGSGLAGRLAGATLQRVFAAAIVLVALFVIVRTVAHQEPQSVTEYFESGAVNLAEPGTCGERK